MAIITISRGSFSHGKEIAEAAARRLGYECISREILIEASRFFDVPEMKLLKSIHDAPNILERITRGRERYLSYIQAALLEHARGDRLVYHGHAGHLLLPRISHVMKVRILAPMDERVAFLQRTKSMTDVAARNHLIKADRERAKWTQYLYEREINDPSVYDIVINIDRLKIEDACDIICGKAESAAFRADEASIRALDDLAVSAHMRAGIQDLCQAEVTAENGIVRVRVLADRIKKSSYVSPGVEKRIEEEMKQTLTQEILKVAGRIEGVKDVILDMDPLRYY